MRYGGSIFYTVVTAIIEGIKCSKQSHHLSFPNIVIGNPPNLSFRTSVRNLSFPVIARVFIPKQSLDLLLPNVVMGNPCIRQSTQRSNLSSQKNRSNTDYNLSTKDLNRSSSFLFFSTFDVLSVQEEY
jgi:hypothetical protein